MYFIPRADFIWFLNHLSSSCWVEEIGAKSNCFPRLLILPLPSGCGVQCFPLVSTEVSPFNRSPFTHLDRLVHVRKYLGIRTKEEDVNTPYDWELACWSLLLNVHLWITYVCVRMHAIAHMWHPEDNFVETIFSLSLCAFRELISDTRIAHRHIHVHLCF